MCETDPTFLPMFFLQMATSQFCAIPRGPGLESDRLQLKRRGLVVTKMAGKTHLNEKTWDNHRTR